MLKKFFQPKFLSILLLYFFGILLISVHAQKPKWGKPTKQEISIDHCPFEKNASAIVLNDYGELEITRNSELYIKRHTRIKILNETGMALANVTLPFYTKNNLEQITTVRAQTINVDEKGKVIKQALSASEIYEIDQSENWKEKRFTLPNIKIGSIIEYTYITLSKNITFLDGWVFQREIPTLHSEFRIVIPEGLDYRILYQGKKLTNKYGNEALNNWSLDNIPSIKEEPHIANYMDYAEKITFQLAGYYKSDGLHPGAGSSYQSLMTTWEKLATERLKSDNYLRYLNKKNRAKDILLTIGDKITNDLEGAKSIYNYVKNSMQWNGKYRLFTRQSLNALLESKQGNSAEINLFLTLLLRRAGLKANPVLLSTRTNGKIFKDYPFLAQFNHLICNVNIDNKDYLLDATDPFRPWDLIANADLNGLGYLLDLKESRWLKIDPNQNTKRLVFSTISFDSLSNCSVKTTLSMSGYEGLKNRKQYWADKKNFLNTAFEMGNSELEILSLEPKYVEEIDETFQLDIQLTPSDNLFDGNTVYFQPVIFNFHVENPFKSETRQYPVDFSYPFHDQIISIIDIPVGYEVAELPENTHIKLSNDYGEFKYNISKNTRRITLRTDFQIKRSMIPAKEYLNLKEFYNILISKLSEPVVFHRR
ncbi:DUF3857 and transglutaminase domain-containing protein [Fulvivirgaceae bacterium BMA10]|uniref:DUF3857 and transglutaminase domain-containing protein n=1 Tax=Splendidivirga corallicola TaxID=3051826 RepID=A0ABT8KI66_9BACT|nr:DUF3857 and transglutaminase domain-containing protein [Fulvivirgaceae bacterium BMA10]